MSGNSQMTSHVDEKYRKLCNVVNKHTLDSVAVKITEDYDDEKLSEPEFQVHPQMGREEYFFSHGYEKYEDVEYDEGKLHYNHMPRKRLANYQMKSEIGFHFKFNQIGDKEETVTKDELVKLITQQQDENPVTAIVASAGSGKTTQIRRIAKETLDSCPVFDYEDKPTTAEQSHFKMVYYAEFKNIGYEEKLKPSNLLFGGLYKNESEEHEAYEWLLEHQSEAILFFDGLDEATWSIDESSEKKMKPYEKGTVSEIMYNLLSRNLLPRVKIVITSREFKVSELPEESRPGEILSLIGLTRDDAEKLFVALVKDGGAGMWDQLKKLSPRLLNLVSIPVFLVLTAVVMTNDPESPPPTTVTELYNRILLCLLDVENIQERNKIMEVIRKLKAIAHQGMVEGRVVFKTSDLAKFGLSSQDVRDLMNNVPSKNSKLLSRKLLRGDVSFFFCHQSFQEFLCASFMSELKKEQFLEFNENQLHQRRWSVVCMFVGGILYGHDTKELHQVAERECNRKMFGQKLQSRVDTELWRVYREWRPRELLNVIFESNNDDLIQSLPRMPDIQRTKVGPDEAHMFSSIWARRGNEKKQEKVDFWMCRLNDELLEIMVQNLKDRKIRVGKLSVMYNSFTTEGLKPFLSIFRADELEIDMERLKELRYEKFDWNDIPVIQWHGSPYDLHVEMISSQEVITIEEHEFNSPLKGCFDKTPRASDTDQRLTLDYSKATVIRPVLLDLLTFFQQKAFPVKFDHLMLVEPSEFARMKSLDVEGEIPKMLLDCREKKKVDSSLIEFCVTKFQVSHLDLVVDGETSFVPSNFLTEIESHISINVKIHWWFYAAGTYLIEKLIPVVQQNQVENLRLLIRSGVSFNHMKHVIESCKMKKLMIVYHFGGDETFKRHGEIVELGAQHSIEVDGATWKDVEGTAWARIDFPECL